MDPEKGKARFIKHFTPYSKYWWKLTLPGVIFFAFGTYFLINRKVSWDFVTSGEFYFQFFWYLVLSSITNYYVFYRPSLKHHLGSGSTAKSSKS
jgi:hypothetical protein